MKTTTCLQKWILATCFLVMSFAATSQAYLFPYYDTDGTFWGCETQDENGFPIVIQADHPDDCWQWDWMNGERIRYGFPYYDGETFWGCAIHDVFTGEMVQVVQADHASECLKYIWNLGDPAPTIIGEAPELEGTYVGEGIEEEKKWLTDDELKAVAAILDIQAKAREDITKQIKAAWRNGPQTLQIKSFVDQMLENIDYWTRSCEQILIYE